MVVGILHLSKTPLTLKAFVLATGIVIDRENCGLNQINLSNLCIGRVDQM